MIGLPYRVMMDTLLRARRAGCVGEVYDWRGARFEITGVIGWIGDGWFACVQEVQGIGGHPPYIHLKRYAITVDGRDCGIYTGVSESEVLEAYERDSGRSCSGATVEEVAS